MCVSICAPACEMRALIVGYLQLEAEVERLRAEAARLASEQAAAAAKLEAEAAAQTRRAEVSLLLL